MGKKITVYSTEACPHCKAAKEYLKEKGVQYTNIDVGSNQEKAQEMIDKSGQMGVPVFDIDGKIVIGFDQAEIEKELK